MNHRILIRLAYLQVDGQDWRQLLDTQLLCGILPAVAVLAGILAQLLSSRETIQTILQPYLNVIRGSTFSFPFLGQVPYVQT